MGTKLYVANLPNAPSALALRAHFSACGVVSEVQIAPERNPGRGRGSAFVRMTSAAGAERARLELNGVPFEGQLLLVEAAPDDVADRRAAATGRAPKNNDHYRAARNDDDSGARITLQFREPANMTYELDCAGIAIVLRVFFADTTEPRVVVHAGNASDVATASASAPSRLEAFRRVARDCRESTGLPALSRINWDAVEKAMLRVRAL